MGAKGDGLRTGLVIVRGKARRSIEAAIADFWTHVDRRPSDAETLYRTHSPCCNWTSCKDKDGYGRFYVEGLFNRAHRFSYFIHTWDHPGDLEVCHTCDNPACVNPYHLFLGDNVINKLDCVTKGRQAKGERQGSAKLTAVEVLEIRRDFAPHVVTQRTLALRYGVTIANVQAVILRKTWRHL